MKPFLINYKTEGRALQDQMDSFAICPDEEIEAEMKPYEKILKKCGVQSIEDLQPHFFDDKELKEKKKKIFDNLSDQEKELIGAELSDMEKKTKDPEENSEDKILDLIPSVFYTEEEYIQGREEVLAIAPQYAAVVPPAEQVPFLKMKKNHLLTKSIQSSFFPKEDTSFRVGDFWYDEGELKYQNEKMGKEIIIGNFWIEILQEITHVIEICNDKNVAIDYAEDTSWKIRIFCMGKVFEAEKDVKSLLSDHNVLKCTKDRGYLESDKDSKRLYRKYINLLIERSDYQSIVLYQSTGWTYLKEYGLVYLTDQGIVGVKENCKIRADVPYHFVYDQNSVNTNQNFWDFWGMREICKRIENSIFLLHFSCVAVMTTIFQNAGRPVNFIVALIGSTNSQKTAVGSVFSRLFDRSTLTSADIRFNSTEVAIIEKMEKYGDAILMVDDFVPYSSAKNVHEQQKKLETIIRSYGDREPRKRSQVYAKINGVSEYSPIKGCCLITGEVFQTESVSSDTRVIQIPFEKGGVNLEKLTYYQENFLIYPTFFYGFIMFLQNNLQWVEELIVKEIKNVRGNHPVEIHTPRFVDTLAIMSSEVKIFYTFAVKSGFMSQQEADIYLSVDMEKITGIIIENERNSKTKTPATEICLALKWGLKIGKIRISLLSELGKLKEFDGIVGEDQTYYYVLPEVLWKVYKEYTCYMNSEVRFRSGRELKTPLKAENLLLIKEEGKGKQQRSTHKIGNFTAKRFFYIYKEEFEKLCKLYEQF